MSIQTINKIGRDYGVTADKYVLAFDSWDSQYSGYYRTYLLEQAGVVYKSSRKFPTVKGLIELSESPDVTKEEVEKYAYELYANQQQIEAKKVLKSLGRIGIPSIWTESLEFDDLAYMAGVVMGKSEKPSVIVTKDSDLAYSVTPELEYFRLPTGGSKPETLTYEQMWDTVPGDVKPVLEQIVNSGNDFGSPLYLYKAILDSLGAGHNDMARTGARGHSFEKVAKEVLSDNYTHVTDPELFKKQLDTFKVMKFPSAINAYQTLCGLTGIGHYPGIPEVQKFFTENEILGITDQYYQGFLDRLDQKLFTE